MSKRGTMNFYPGYAPWYQPLYCIILAVKRVEKCLLLSYLESLPLVCLTTSYQPHWILPCTIFNVAIFASCIENICITLMCIILCWFAVKNSHYTYVRQCVVRRLFGFVIIISFMYPIFINMMTCDKKSFCPEIISSIFNPHKKNIALEKIFNYLSCRVIAFKMIYYFKFSALILTSLCITIRSILDCIKKANIFRELETIELQTGQSAPLPPFQNSLRLRQSTMVIIILLSGLVSSVHAAVVFTGNLYMTVFVSLVLTIPVPLVTILLEKPILRFCLSDLVDLFRNFW